MLGQERGTGGGQVAGKAVWQRHRIGCTEARLGLRLPRGSVRQQSRVLALGGCWQDLGAAGAPDASRWLSNALPGATAVLVFEMNWQESVLGVVAAFVLSTLSLGALGSCWDTLVAEGLRRCSRNLPFPIPTRIRGGTFGS